MEEESKEKLLRKLENDRSLTNEEVGTLHELMTGQPELIKPYVDKIVDIALNRKYDYGKPLPYFNDTRGRMEYGEWNDCHEYRSVTLLLDLQKIANIIPQLVGEAAKRDKSIALTTLAYLSYATQEEMPEKAQKLFAKRLISDNEDTHSQSFLTSDSLWHGFGVDAVEDLAQHGGFLSHSYPEVFLTSAARATKKYIDFPMFAEIDVDKLRRAKIEKVREFQNHLKEAIEKGEFDKSELPTMKFVLRKDSIVPEKSVDLKQRDEGGRFLWESSITADFTTATGFTPEKFLKLDFDNLQPQDVDRIAGLTTPFRADARSRKLSKEFPMVSSFMPGHLPAESIKCIWAEGSALGTLERDFPHLLEKKGEQYFLKTKIKDGKELLIPIHNRFALHVQDRMAKERADQILSKKPKRPKKRLGLLHR